MNSCRIALLGYGSTDLRLETSTKLKMVNYQWYRPHNKKQNLFLNNLYKLYLTKILFKPSYTDILKILGKWLFCQVKGNFKVLWLFETKTFLSKVVNNFDMHIFQKISFLLNLLCACVDLFYTLCRSIKPQIYRQTLLSSVTRHGMKQFTKSEATRHSSFSQVK